MDWFVTERERDETEIDQEGETGYGENMMDLREIRKYEGWRDRRERVKSENMSEIRKYEGEGERAHIKTGKLREIIK